MPRRAEVWCNKWSSRPCIWFCICWHVKLYKGRTAKSILCISFYHSADSLPPSSAESKCFLGCHCFECSRCTSCVHCCPKVIVNPSSSIYCKVSECLMVSVSLTNLILWTISIVSLHNYLILALSVTVRGIPNPTLVHCLLGFIHMAHAPAKGNC